MYIYIINHIHLNHIHVVLENKDYAVMFFGFFCFYYFVNKNIKVELLKNCDIDDSGF